MKVSEMIEFLKTCDQDATIVTDCGANVTRLTGDFQDVEPQQVLEAGDYEYEGKRQDKMLTDEDGDPYRKVVVIATVDCLLDI